MGVPYTELCLYLGSCPGSFTIGEGKLHYNSTSDEEQRRFNQAADDVRRFLEPANNNRIEVLDLFSIVKSEAEAAGLIRHAESAIPNAKGSFVLSHCVEYDIIFRRTIRFDGYTVNEDTEIIELMKRAGHVHKKPDRDLLHISLRNKGYPLEELERLFKDGGVHEDAIWKNSLTYHQS